MNKSLLTGAVIILTLTSCESIIYNTDDAYLFKAGNGPEYKYSDFELYDSSTHMLYFRTGHHDLITEKSAKFSVLAEGEEIYKGVFWPSCSSSLPYGAFIHSSPSFYPEYALRIGFMTIDNQPEDTRNDPRIISALKERNLLHSGLSASINSISTKGTQLNITFTVTNKDETDLLILDPERTGPNLFHYFTNGLYIRTLTYEEVFSGNIEAATPSPWNSWKPGWLSEIKSGESRQFSINYSIRSSINPGDYLASFEFPGLAFQVTRDQLWQGNNRIWLGDVMMTKKITIK